MGKGFGRDVGVQWTTRSSRRSGRIADEFDAVHSVERARRVGSLDAVLPAGRMRPHLIGLLHRALGVGEAAAARD